VDGVGSHAASRDHEQVKLLVDGDRGDRPVPPGASRAVLPLAMSEALELLAGSSPQFRPSLIADA
jgi:hypothetical protein